MRAPEREIARKNLDKKLKIMQNTEVLARPPRGWIKAIREALGMSSTQLARRLGVSQPRVLAIEKAEATGSIKLESLERAARALDCRLVYTLVPRKPFETMVEDRARGLARNRLQATSHSMALEDQQVDQADEQVHLERLMQKLLNQPGSKLWEDQ